MQISHNCEKVNEAKHIRLGVIHTSAEVVQSHNCRLSFVKMKEFWRSQGKIMRQVYEKNRCKYLEVSETH